MSGISVNPHFPNLPMEPGSPCFSDSEENILTLLGIFSFGSSLTQTGSSNVLETIENSEPKSLFPTPKPLRNETEDEAVTN